MDTDTRREVVSVMRKVGFQEDELLDGARIAEDLEIDSTEMVEVVVAMEERFGISIDTDAEDTFKTFADLIACVHRLRFSGVAATEG